MNDFGTFSKMPKNEKDLGKLIVAKGFKKLPKVQKIANSGHTVQRGHCQQGRRQISLKWAIPGLLFLIFVFSTVNSTYVNYKFCRWLRSNCGPLTQEATALPTETQPLPFADRFLCRCLTFECRALKSLNIQFKCVEYFCSYLPNLL